MLHYRCWGSLHFSRSAEQPVVILWRLRCQGTIAGGRSAGVSPIAKPFSEPTSRISRSPCTIAQSLVSAVANMPSRLPRHCNPQYPQKQKSLRCPAHRPPCNEAVGMLDCQESAWGDSRKGQPAITISVWGYVSPDGGVILSFPALSIGCKELRRGRSVTTLMTLVIHEREVESRSWFIVGFRLGRRDLAPEKRMK